MTNCCIHSSLPICIFKLSYVACSLKNNVASLSQWPPESSNHLWPEDVTTLGHLTVSTKLFLFSAGALVTAHTEGTLESA